LSQSDEPRALGVALRCDCPGCRSPWARFVDGELVVVSEHHGRKHVNRLSLAEFLELMRQEGQPAGA
jgi:hypothetical protein